LGQKYHIQILFTIILIPFGIISFTPLAFADHTPCSEEPDWDNRPFTKPEVYLLDIELLDIGEIDLKSGSYEMSFWISIEPENAEIDYTKYPPPTLEFVNGRIPEEGISGEYCSSDYYEYKVHGTFYNIMNFENYPFEILELNIEIESISPGYSTVVKLKDFGLAEVIDESINVPGWRITPFVSVEDHTYPGEDFSFSRYAQFYELSGFVGQQFLKVIFPMMLLPGLALLSFWMGPKSRSDKIGLAVGTLLAAVAFNAIFLSEQLPPLGYLTLADKVALVGYALFLYAIAGAIIQTRLSDSKGETAAMILNKKMRYAIPVIIIVLFIPLWMI